MARWKSRQLHKAVRRGLAALLCLALLLCLAPPGQAEGGSSGRIRALLEDGCYRLAIQWLYECRFQEAERLFAAMEGYRDSERYLSLCRERMEAEARHEVDLYIHELFLAHQFPGGKLYANSWGLIYVPDDCDSHTRFLVYFAGGIGQPLLYERGVYEYLGANSPSAVILFYYQSGFPNYSAWNSWTVDFVKQIALECGIFPHDMAVVGSSAGSCTALHAAAALYSEGRLEVNCAIALDMANDWKLEKGYELSAEECRLLREMGTKLYLFEQKGEGMDNPAIRQMVARGADVSIVECRDDDHNQISALAYRNAVFSWAVGDYRLLDPIEYKVIPLPPRQEERPALK